ncbi:MAG: hypothetical protein PF541_01615 [Prolixibacteraceae bacterium]|jgi:hypothetical protein|nr:hypothetical protein [Prolixibacteraceae bacterium]
MKKLFLFLSSILLICFFLSCGPSQREMAVRQINSAKQSILNGDTLQSISKLDSVSKLYPKAEIQIGVAKNMTKELYQQLKDKRVLQSIKNDSLLQALESKFIKEKTEFDTYTQYIPKRQTFNRSWDRSFLQVHLDERGELYLSSNYMGKEWLRHTGIRVYDGKHQAKSEKIELDNQLNHQSDFLDHKWEKVSYMNGKADSVIHFIAENPTLNLKCVFIGKRYYYILLEKYDIESVIDALALSDAIKRQKELAIEIKVYESKIKLL